MEPKGFSVGEMLKFGWRTTMAHKWFLFGVMLTMVVLMAIPYGAALYFISSDQPTTQQWLIFGVLMVIFFIVVIWLSLGALKIALRYAEGLKPRYRDLFIGLSYVWKFFLGHLLYLLVTTVGLLLFVIPGVIWGLRYSMFAYHIVEQGVGPVEAFKMSAKTTYGGKWDILALQIVNAIVNYLGAICLLVGMFVTVPATMIAMAYAYKKLSSRVVEVVTPPVTVITDKQ
jgi:uncharacterized membrane protein